MALKRKALVILTPGFPENEEDTTCLPERQIFVKALKEDNPFLEVIVLTFEYPFIRKNYRWYGIDVFAFNGGKPRRINRIFIWFLVWQKLNFIRRKYKIIGIMSFWLGPSAFIGSRFAKKHKLKHYCWVLGQDARAGNKYVSLIKPSPDSLICLSDFLADEFFKNYLIRPRHIMPTGIDIRLFETVSEERSIDILGAGSLISLKRYDLFLEIVQVLTVYFPNLKVLLCGKGPLEKDLMNKIEQLNIRNNIRLTGELPHAEVLKVMQRSKILMHTSSYEGFATVILEALYAGAHVVCFCKPMKDNIEQLHVVDTKKAMIKKVYELLTMNSTHNNILPYSIKEVTRQTMALFTTDLL